MLYINFFSRFSSRQQELRKELEKRDADLAEKDKMLNFLTRESDKKNEEKDKALGFCQKLIAIVSKGTTKLSTR